MVSALLILSCLFLMMSQPVALQLPIPMCSCCSCFVREMSARYRNTFILSTQSYAALSLFGMFTVFLSLFVFVNHRYIGLFCIQNVYFIIQICCTQNC